MATQFLKVADGRLAYETTGSGPLVIAAPSMGDLRGEYRFLAPQLASAGYRVVSLDLRGHGETSVRWPDYSVAGLGQDLLDLVRALDAGPAILIGDSIAAGAAVWAATEAPELVRGMVLLGAAVRGEFRGPIRLLLSALFTRPWGPSAWIAFFKTLFPTRKPADFAAYTTGLKRNLSEPGRLEALHQMMLSSKAASEERLPRVSAPTLVLMGTKDPDFQDPAAEAAWVAGRLNGSFEMVAGAGHYPHVEMPEVTGPRILEFLKAIETEVDHATAGRA
ncbi:MAG TPA: alpha/beta hydrolase [Anaerolineaceae bacterium]|nr:alpha/beta hydrolase [Anaerolineaceae bacterium]